MRSRVSREYAHEDVGWFRCLQEAFYCTIRFTVLEGSFYLLYYDSTKLYCSTRYGFRHGHVSRYLMSYNLYITPLGE